MAERNIPDQCPGPVPDIRADGDAIIFELYLPSEHARLIIRCEPDGEVRVSVVLAGQPG